LHCIIIIIIIMLQSIWKTITRERSQRGMNKNDETPISLKNKKDHKLKDKSKSKGKGKRSDKNSLDDDNFDESSTSTKKTIDTVEDDLALDHFPDFHDIETIRSITTTTTTTVKSKSSSTSTDANGGSEEEEGEEEDDDDSDGIASDTDEEDVEEQRKRYQNLTKEDQDVQVFLALAERMSLSSLLHLLQGHVRTADNLSNDCLQPYKDIAQAETNRQRKILLSTSRQSRRLRRRRRQVKRKSSGSDGDVKEDEQDHGEDQEHDDDDDEEEGMSGPKRKKIKKFRFAEVTNNQVRVVVHEVESWKEFKNDIWWTPQEMQQIRKDLIEMVYFFRKHHAGYIQSVQAVALEDNDKHIVDEHLKRLTQGGGGSLARGLEAHIVQLLSDHRKQTIQAVLEEQLECWNSKDDNDLTSNCLREMSLSYSTMSATFAHRMAQTDEIEALKANMSKWRAVPSAQTAVRGGFFGDV
jgi:hypothetical protein